MSDRVGQQIGNYRLVSRLGRGGFAEVYLGENVHILTKVAIKFLEIPLSQQHQEGLLREAKIVARFRHQHIVLLHDCGIDTQHRNTPYLIMEYAPNGTLRDRHPRGTAVPLSTIVEYVKQIAKALQYAHDSGLIHRDLKPENVLIGNNGELLLSDFGVAATVHSAESLQTGKLFAGTPAYSAPEQTCGKPSPASDQYSPGVVVYEWLCGKPPFEGNPFDVILHHRNAPPPPLHGRGLNIPPEVEAVIMKALAKDPKDRFESVQTFAAAFEHALPSPPPPPPPEQLAKEGLPEQSPDQIGKEPEQIDATPHTPVVPLATEEQKPPQAKAVSPIRHRLSKRQILLRGVCIVATGLCAVGTYYQTRTHDQSWFAIIAIIGLFVSCWLWFLYLLYYLDQRHERWYLENGIKTTATIVSVNNRTDLNFISNTPIYTYSAQMIAVGKNPVSSEENFRYQKRIHWGIFFQCYSLGSPVTIRVHPKKPKKYLISWQEDWAKRVANRPTDHPKKCYPLKISPQKEEEQQENKKKLTSKWVSTKNYLHPSTKGIEQGLILFTGVQYFLSFWVAGLILFLFPSLHASHPTLELGLFELVANLLIAYLLMRLLLVLTWSPKNAYNACLLFLAFFLITDLILAGLILVEGLL